MSTNWHAEAVALTGTIGSGKSTVAGILKSLGATVVSADELAREAVKPGSAELLQIAEKFGAQVLLPDGSLDRKKLGEIVFSDPAKRKALEAITHPVIKQLAAKAFEHAKVSGAKLIVYECPLLFEAKLEGEGFRKIVLVTAPAELCLSRMIKRDKLSESEAKKRIASQLPIEEKRLRSDIIIENSGSLDELKARVVRLYSELAFP